jgi:hypothetical protein
MAVLHFCLDDRGWVCVDAILGQLHGGVAVHGVLFFSVHHLRSSIGEGGLCRQLRRGMRSALSVLGKRGLEMTVAVQCRLCSAVHLLCDVRPRLEGMVLRAS